MFLLARGAVAATYEVGPGKKLSALGEVPWESLQPGDTVLIHARAEPYREKFVICRAGQRDAPITVRGVPDADGKLPALDGDGATTRANLNFWGDSRSVIKIGGANNPPDTMPSYIVIENLDVRDARPPFTFVDASGKTQPYRKNASAIFIEKGEHITIRGCRLHDCGNGLFVSSSDERAARDIFVAGNSIFGNGNERSGQEHNVYTAAIGIIFEANHFGPLRTNCLGNNLKDRSAGLVVRGNWIEGGNKELDLVDAEDSALIRADARYHEALVTDNIFVKLKSDGHPQLVHYGGDSDKPANYRKGTLHFSHNTIVSERAATTLLWLSSSDEHCDFRGNIACALSPNGKITVVENAGVINLSHNWFSSGWKKIAAPKATAEIRDDETSLSGTSPGFVEANKKDFRLEKNSQCRGLGATNPIRAQ